MIGCVFAVIILYGRINTKLKKKIRRVKNNLLKACKRISASYKTTVLSLKTNKQTHRKLTGAPI